MKFNTLLSIVSIVTSISAQDPGAEIRAKRTCPAKIAPAAQQDPSRAQFAPDLGATPGLQDPVCVQNKFGERTSQVKPVKVPCDCPPAQADFAKQFAIDHGTKIDNSGSVAGRENNLRLAIQTLQGSFCCPAGSVTLNDQLTKAASGGGQPSKNNGGAVNAPTPTQDNKGQQAGAAAGAAGGAEATVTVTETVCATPTGLGLGNNNQAQATITVTETVCAATPTGSALTGGKGNGNNGGKGNNNGATGNNNGATGNNNGATGNNNGANANNGATGNNNGANGNNGGVNNNQAQILAQLRDIVAKMSQLLQ
ncbi:hypothetical protein BC833DRAFT_604057 [Globomyces pollinis-pini]|nr:hypothetical protein BC833DRAFT_604057 [Globomyces pollinis-pini]